jgi:hypothetical protein
LASTFNPKVAGSIPARPTQAQSLQTDSFYKSPVASRTEKRVQGQQALLTRETLPPLAHDYSPLEPPRTSPRSGVETHDTKNSKVAD